MLSPPSWWQAMLQIGIVVSGRDYQEAAAWAATTYVRHLKSPETLTVFLPQGEAEAELLKEHSRSFGFCIERFYFRTISPHKFTSQLKCQGFHHAISHLTNGDVLFLVDADTYCLGPIEPGDNGKHSTFNIQHSTPNGHPSERSLNVECLMLNVECSKTQDSATLAPSDGERAGVRGFRIGHSINHVHVLHAIEQGSIALVPDIKDRHDEETSSTDPWYLAPQERLAYVNSGIIGAGRASLGLFEKFRELSEQPAFLRGPFNDQKVINFALGRHFRDKLVLLDERFNYIHRPGQFKRPPDGTLIGHCAGGAGWINYANGYRKRAHQKICEAILGGAPWPY